MFLVSQEFVDSTHGSLGCITCHGGANEADKAVAHEGMDPYPSRNFDANCGACHGNVTDVYATSIHYNLHGMENGLAEFADVTSLSESPHHEEYLTRTASSVMQPVETVM